MGKYGGGIAFNDNRG